MDESQNRLELTEKEFILETIISKQRTHVEIDLRKTSLNDLTLVKIISSFGHPGKEHKETGTGLLISEKVILTAAHVIFSRKHNKYFDKIIATYFIDGKFKVREAKKKSITRQQEYKQNISDWKKLCQYQYGLITLAEDQNQQLKGPQTMPMLGSSQFNIFQEKVLQIQNNPNKAMILGFGVRSKEQHNQDIMTTLKISTGYFFRDGKFLKYKMDTLRGMSGGAILQVINKKIKLIGIHVGGKSLINKREQDTNLFKNNKLVCSPRTQQQIDFNQIQSMKVEQQFNLGLSIDVFGERIKVALKKEFGYHKVQIFTFPELQEKLDKQKKLLKTKAFEEIDHVLMKTNINYYEKQLIKKIIYREKDLSQEQYNLILSELQNQNRPQNNLIQNIMVIPEKKPSIIIFDQPFEDKKQSEKQKTRLNKQQLRKQELRKQELRKQELRKQESRKQLLRNVLIGVRAYFKEMDEKRKKIRQSSQEQRPQKKPRQEQRPQNKSRQEQRPQTIIFLTTKMPSQNYNNPKNQKQDENKRKCEQIIPTANHNQVQDSDHNQRQDSKCNMITQTNLQNNPEGSKKTTNQRPENFDHFYGCPCRCSIY